MKTIIILSLALSIFSGLCMAIEIIGTATNVQGTIWVQHEGGEGRFRVTEGMAIQNKDQFILERGSSYKANSAFDVPAVTFTYGENCTWDAEKGIKLPPKALYPRTSSVITSY